MEEYKQLYYYLFNRLSQLSEEIAKIQNSVEEMFLSQTKSDNDT